MEEIITVLDPISDRTFTTTKEALLYNLTQLNEFVRYTTKEVLTFYEYFEFFGITPPPVDWLKGYGWFLSDSKKPTFSFIVIYEQEGDVYELDYDVDPKPIYSKDTLQIHYASYDGTKLDPDTPEDGSWGLFITKNGAMEVARYKSDILDHFYPSQAMIQIDDVIAWIDLDDIRKLVRGINDD